ncbi:Oidioi.mRNA.OKI2018_I69.PAR.g8896.t1.cds [Oikopleura dioica]|uniref:Oidioi.mRNA.OKI2018_I69.PAR.g8896.t1.cds n=1 Tax=Oikopleura dioica TaxID=34765 RepID=A0ABN7RI29_OIKDI|nr:Oidioi.mRNA.OKI2018_I69.PAR.g8896.t1.cds [Oikopleura dioica]
MDISIVLYAKWQDPRLHWFHDQTGFVTELSIDPSLIWTPPIEIVNLDLWRNLGKKTDFSCVVNSFGIVNQAYKIRLVTACEMSSKFYPFDVQNCSVNFATPSQTQDRLILDIRQWKIKNTDSFIQSYNLPFTISYNETKLDLLQNTFYDGNPAWELLNYKAPRLLFLFLLTVIGSVYAHIIITVSLWCQDKSEDRIFEFSKHQAKFALLCARFFEKFICGKYTIPSVILRKCGVERKNTDNNDENEEFEKYQKAWIFYAKMLSHFWALILTVTIITVTFGIIIDLHVQSSKVLDEIFAN